MKTKVKWGVIGVAGIATEKVIPAMQRGEWSEVVAIASRNVERAEQAAEQLGIGKAYGSYEELLADPDIEAIYNPLPNHLHVPWSIKAAEAGKHVLCEKPISLTVEEARSLLEARDCTGVRIGRGVHDSYASSMAQGPRADRGGKDWDGPICDRIFQLQQSGSEEHSQHSSNTGAAG